MSKENSQIKENCKMSKKQVMAEIIRHTSLSDGIFDMTLKAEEIAGAVKKKCLIGRSNWIDVFV